MKECKWENDDFEFDIPEDDIQCKKCIFANKEKIMIGDICVFDKAESAECEKFKTKPKGILFPLDNGLYNNCPFFSNK